MKRNLIIIVVGCCALLVWMISKPGAHEALAQPAASAKKEALFAVKVVDSNAQSVSREVVFSGYTAPNRSVQLRAELKGKALGWAVDQGQAASKGEALLSIEKLDRLERHRHAQSLLNQRKIEHQSAQSLFERGLESETNLARAQSQLDEAQLQLRQAEIELERSVIRAPFDGYLVDHRVDPGDYLSENTSVGHFVDLNPVLIEGTLTQEELSHVQVKERGLARLSNGMECEGYVSYLSPDGEVSTRLFPIEFTLEPETLRPQQGNPLAYAAHLDGPAIASGLTAQVTIDADQTFAHKVSPSVLTLNPEGLLGVKLVEADDTVRFYPAQVIKFDQQFVWLGGLPERARIISMGHGFTQDGQRVRPVLEP